MPLPGWVGILQAAAAWGCPPWEITGEQPPNRIIWLLRRGAYDSEVARAGRDKEKHNQ